MKDLKNVTPPWVVQGAIDWLLSRSYRFERVYEFGAGNSIEFWGTLGRDAVCIEHDTEWFKKLLPKCPDNVQLWRYERPYHGHILTYPDNFFDFVFVDGRDRVQCMIAATNKVREGGYLMLDNSERPKYAEGIAHLLKHNFTEVHCWKDGWQTTLYKKIDRLAGKDRWHNTFLGIHQQHTYWLYKVIDDVLDCNPQIDRFIEIGTGNGALSVFLGLHALKRGTFLFTYDIKERKAKKELDQIFKALDIVFVQADCFDHPHLGIVGDIETPIFLMCDGGDKKKEFNYFAPFLPKGSIIAAHDYGVEILPEHISETVQTLELEPIIQDEWRKQPDDIQCCFYKVTK
jgi:predicted O-methyltransferase YrrM